MSGIVFSVYAVLHKMLEWSLKALLLKFLEMSDPILPTCRIFYIKWVSRFIRELKRPHENAMNIHMDVFKCS